MHSELALAEKQIDRTDGRLQKRLEKAKSKVRVIHTLGPIGTNLCLAAKVWLNRQHGDTEEPEVVLHKTVESAVTMLVDPHHGLMTCAVYPFLHDIVFNNLSKLWFIDSFIYPTFPMVLASKFGVSPQQVATHMAPSCLVSVDAEAIIVDSNSQAALDCVAGIVDGCITTAAAADMYNLKIVSNFGSIPMVFTLHGLRGLEL